MKASFRLETENITEYDERLSPLLIKGSHPDTGNSLEVVHRSGKESCLLEQSP
ncbi:hypothetical protein EV648_12522 [Kribbella sp. VKM Ac-2568]|nr:hypothetical protein EV648_12522 [Kribbella sp. VKM Ac-2568]